MPRGPRQKSESGIYHVMLQTQEKGFTGGSDLLGDSERAKPWRKLRATVRVSTTCRVVV